MSNTNNRKHRRNEATVTRDQRKAPAGVEVGKTPTPEDFRRKLGYDTEVWSDAFKKELDARYERVVRRNDDEDNEPARVRQEM